MTRYVPPGSKKTPGPVIKVKGTSRGLKALQSYMNDSYHKSVLYVKGTMGGIRYGGNLPFRPLDIPLNTKSLKV